MLENLNMKKIYKHFESFQLIQPHVPGSLSSFTRLTSKPEDYKVNRNT